MTDDKFLLADFIGRQNRRTLSIVWHAVDNCRSLETKEYNYITATYFLLAERLLRKRADAKQASAGGPSGSAADNEHLSPLALSPRSDLMFTDVSL